MKKYNLSNIMKNAWTIRKTTNCTMRNALKRAWTTEKSRAIETKMFELVKASDAKIIGGQMLVSRGTSADVIAEVKEHKSMISAYLSGDCFLRQAQMFDAPVEWCVLKTSANPYVSFAPVEVFRGTAGEVDDWMSSHKNDKCTMEWENGAICQAEYVTGHCA